MSNSRNLKTIQQELSHCGLTLQSPLLFFKCSCCGEEYPILNFCEDAPFRSLFHLYKNNLYITSTNPEDYQLSNSFKKACPERQPALLQELVGCERRVQDRFADQGIRALRPMFSIEHEGQTVTYFSCPICQTPVRLGNYEETIESYIKLGGRIKFAIDCETQALEAA